MREYRREATDLIREYLHDLRVFSVGVMELVNKISV